MAGHEVPAGAVAELALRLHNAGESDLAQRVGTAVDTNRSTLEFVPHERGIVLSVLQECPDGLAELRATLLEEHTWRQRDGLTDR